MCRRLEEPRPELDIDLNPGASESRGVVPGLGSRTQVQVVDGSTGHGNAVTTKRCGLVFRGRPDIIGGRGIVKHLHLAIFCVARAKCGVPETDCSRNALFRISNSEQTMFEFYQVMSLGFDVISGRLSRLLFDSLRSDSGLWPRDLPEGRRRNNSDSGEVQTRILRVR